MEEQMLWLQRTVVGLRSFPWCACAFCIESHWIQAALFCHFLSALWILHSTVFKPPWKGSCEPTPSVFWRTVSSSAAVSSAWEKQTNQESRFRPLAVAQVPNLLFGNQEAVLPAPPPPILWENFHRWALRVCLSYGRYQCLPWGGREESPDQVAFKLAHVSQVRHPDRAA